MGVIRLKNMLFYGYHGVNESEKELGGKFEVDLELYNDLTDQMIKARNKDNQKLYDDLKKQRSIIEKRLHEYTDN